MHKKDVILFANPNSPHVKRWLDLLSHTDYSVEIYHCEKSSSLTEVPCHKIFSYFGVFRYVIAGLICRFFMLSKRKNVIYHAHCTSGYGLIAYLSGVDYIVTTYGTEIFSIDSKGTMYKQIIGLILKKAKLITTTSSGMDLALNKYFPETTNKILRFSMGVSLEVFQYSESAGESIRKRFNLPFNETIWFANRRITPLYNTINIVTAFQDYYKDQKSGCLILLKDEANMKYFRKIKDIISAAPDNIYIIKETLSPSEMVSLLSLADYTISIPASDQLSASILESMACRSIPVLTKLNSYNYLYNNKLAFFIDSMNAEVFDYLNTERLSLKKEFAEKVSIFIKNEQSDSVIIEKIKSLYAKYQK